MSKIFAHTKCRLPRETKLVSIPPFRCLLMKSEDGWGMVLFKTCYSDDREAQQTIGYSLKLNKTLQAIALIIAGVARGVDPVLKVGGTGDQFI